MINLKKVLKSKLFYVVCLVCIFVGALLVGSLFFKKPTTTGQKITPIPATTGQKITPIPATTGQKITPSLARINKVLFFFCVIGGWLIATLNNINKEATAIIVARKKWEGVKGGEKPAINWTGILSRSFFLLIIGVLIIYIAPEVMVKIQKLLI